MSAISGKTSPALYQKCHHQKEKDGCVSLPEWAELPEWTTGMDFYMQSLVLLMYFICSELHINIVAIEGS